MYCTGNHELIVRPAFGSGLKRLSSGLNEAFIPQLPDRQRPDIAPVGRLFHYNVTIKWPVKWLRDCDVKRPHGEPHVLDLANGQLMTIQQLI